jgi:hypothetical protein
VVPSCFVINGVIPESTRLSAPFVNAQSPGPFRSLNPLGCNSDADCFAGATCDLTASVVLSTPNMLTPLNLGPQCRRRTACVTDEVCPFGRWKAGARSDEKGRLHNLPSSQSLVQPGLCKVTSRVLIFMHLMCAGTYCNAGTGQCEANGLRRWEQDAGKGTGLILSLHSVSSLQPLISRPNMVFSGRCRLPGQRSRCLLSGSVSIDWRHGSAMMSSLNVM